MFITVKPHKDNFNHENEREVKIVKDQLGIDQHIGCWQVEWSDST